MDSIKTSFDKVKQDVNTLKAEIGQIRQELTKIQNSILNLNTFVKSDRQSDNQTQIPTQNQTDNYQNQTIRHENSTNQHIFRQTNTENYPFQALKNPNINISTGNKGVSTDRQTNQQTDRQTQYSQKNTQNTLQQVSTNPSIILSQLDNIKQDLRQKIKSLTKQEMLVFSSIYQFQDQGYIVDYPLLAQNLNLSESSIRDYIHRISQKQLPIIKEKVNNKRIILYISKDFRKLTSLNTLLKLREF